MSRPYSAQPAVGGQLNKTPLGRSGFTIVELLAATAVLALIAVVILSIMSQTSQAVRTSNARVESFQSAREGFDTLTRQLGQATLNTYYDYYDSSRNPRTAANSSSFTPNKYGRQSDLHFISGNNLVPAPWEAVSHSVFFQMPMGYAANPTYSGMENLLNACGFFVAYGSDTVDRPDPPGDKAGSPQYRFRLYRMSQPTEGLAVYSGTTKNWFEAPLADASDKAGARKNSVYPIADNIVALVIWPKLPPSQENYNAPTLASNYDYNSRTTWASGSQPEQMHQLPPLLDVAMVTIDEESANRLLKGVTSSAAAQSALGISLNGKFNTASTSQIEADLRSIEQGLTSKGAKCRIFRAVIPLRGSKWSSS